MWLFHLGELVFALIALYFSGEWVVNGVVRLARFLGWKEFSVAFLVMAGAASLPNIFIGVNAALASIPELSLGDVFSNNIIALTVGMAVAVFFARRGQIPTAGRFTETISFLTLLAAVLPALLLADGVLSRSDGLILLIVFTLYLRWFILHRAVANHQTTLNADPGRLRLIFKDIFLISSGMILLLLASRAAVNAATFFAAALGVPIFIIGLLLTGWGNALPEIYFAAAAAKRGDTSLVLGGLMGSVIIPATLVLGLVAVSAPMIINDTVLVGLSRLAVATAALVFYAATITGRAISRQEAFILLAIFVVFNFLLLKDHLI